MSKEYFKENLAATQAEIDKKTAERDLMLENIVDERRRKKAEWNLQVASSKIDKEQTFPKAAEMKQSQAAQPGFQVPLADSQYIDDKIAKMTAPRAAQIGQPQAVQIGEQKYSRQIIDEYIARMTAPSAAEQPTDSQIDYPEEYKPRSR